MDSAHDRWYLAVVTIWLVAMRWGRIGPAGNLRTPQTRAVVGRETNTMKTRNVRFMLVAMVAAFAAVAAACSPTPPPAPINWSFKGTSMTVNQPQDAIYDPIFHACIAIPNCDDEPYLIQIAFRVRIGEPNSAQAWVIKGATLPSTSKGQTRTLTGAQQAEVDFNGVQPLDVLDALNPANKMDIVGTYTWAAEEDTINSLTGGAQSVADVFKTALNQTLAAGTLPSGDTNSLLNMVFNALFGNFNTPFKLILSNIPCLGLCDDVLGGAVYVGLGATGTLASLLDSALGSFAVPNVSIPVVTVPPDVQGGGFYTMGGVKDFTQSFSGAGGQHTYTFQSGPAPAAAV